MKFSLWVWATFILLNPISSGAKKSKKKKRKERGTVQANLPLKLRPDDGTSPICNACEGTGFHAHALLTQVPASYPALEDWPKRLAEGCAVNTDRDGSCDLFLTDANVKTISNELFEMSQDGTDEDVVDLPLSTMQEIVCFDLTQSCPDGTRGTTRHVFRPGRNDFTVSLTFHSKLDEGDVEVFWLDPSHNDTTPQPSNDSGETMKPGTSQHHSSYHGHRFRLLGPGAAWDDPWARADVTLHTGHKQAYVLVKNEAFEPGLPLEVPEAEAPPLGWDEEEDGAWVSSFIPNPLLATNRMYFLHEVDPEHFSPKDEL